MLETLVQRRTSKRLGCKLALFAQYGHASIGAVAIGTVGRGDPSAVKITQVGLHDANVGSNASITLKHLDSHRDGFITITRSTSKAFQ